MEPKGANPLLSISRYVYLSVRYSSEHNGLPLG
jgi:hypothetical protein